MFPSKQGTEDAEQATVENKDILPDGFSDAVGYI